MSKFFSEKFSKLVAYTPGEQPKNRTFVKLNTNESPFPPIKEAVEIAKSASENTHLYSDPECSQFRSALAIGNDCARRIRQINGFIECKSYLNEINVFQSFNTCSKSEKSLRLL
jgi:histidinol-phosphate/aromatic aminotransferase/cobyric acid decarboxylase-like protein